MLVSNKLSFSGHETFYCRYLWLKKGYDFLSDGKNFNSEDAIVDLGVGKNMISSIKFWLKAFGLININQGHIELTNLAKIIFDNKGYDPYLEDLGTIWLLHYYLVKNETASIYSIVFNEFRKERAEFDKSQLVGYIKWICDANKIKINQSTIEKDAKVFISSYIDKEDKGSIENDFSNFLSDLNLIERKEHPVKNGDFIYSIERKQRKDLPVELILFTILDNFENNVSISFRSLLNEINSPGNIFILHEDDLKHKITKITEQYSNIVYRENAGIGDLQIKGKLDKWQILDEYYAN